MEYATIQLKVPKEMQVYFTDDYAFESNEELKRNALLLYPYIHNNTISHGRAAEILGINNPAASYGVCCSQKVLQSGLIPLISPQGARY